jgi:hypothetical protein
MAAQTGRSTFKYVLFYVDDSAGTLTVVPELMGLSVVGLQYDEVDVTAWSDAVKNALPGHPDAPITARFRFSTTLFTHLRGIVGAETPLSLDIRFGIRHAWETGEPQFGITSSATIGYICTSVGINPEDMTVEAKFVVMGATAPAFGTAAET